MSKTPSQSMENNEALKVENKTTFGFWVYIMTDLVLFSSLFATFAVLRNNTFGGPTGAQLLDLPTALWETLILLTSTFMCSLIAVSMQRNKIAGVVCSLVAAFVLGCTFLAMELNEFSGLIASGNGPQRNGFLSAFFTLVGTHGIHIAVGLLWILIMLFYVIKRGLTTSIKRKLGLFVMYWHFLDIVWIFIFTIVYLYGHV